MPKAGSMQTPFYQFQRKFDERFIGFTSYSVLSPITKLETFVYSDCHHIINNFLAKPLGSAVTPTWEGTEYKIYIVHSAHKFDCKYEPLITSGKSATFLLNNSSIMASDH